MMQPMPMGPMNANQGMPAGMQACPLCGSPMPMPDSSGMAPNIPLPPAQLAMGGGGQPDSGLLQALMGGGQ